MLSRVLGVATAMLVLSVAAVPAQAQNLEAGKSSAQIFSGSCAVCHKSPRGLLKSVAPGALPGFLRQHYTTSPDMASQLSAYVISNGANDPRGGGLTRQGQDLVSPRRPVEARPDARPENKPAVAAPAPAAEAPSFFNFGRKPAEPPQEVARPDAEPPMTARQKRAAERAARRLERQKPPVQPAESAPPAAARPAVLGEPPVPIESEPVRSGKPKASKKNRRGQQEPPKADAAKDQPKDEPKDQPKSEMAPPKQDAKPVVRPVEETRPEPVKPEPRPEPAPATPLRADPVPAVTPAPELKPEPKPEQESRPAVEPSSSAPAPTPPTPTPPDNAVPPAAR